MQLKLGFLHLDRVLRTLQILDLHNLYRLAFNLVVVAKCYSTVQGQTAYPHERLVEQVRVDRCTFFILNVSIQVYNVNMQQLAVCLN